MDTLYQGVLPMHQAIGLYKCMWCQRATHSRLCLMAVPRKEQLSWFCRILQAAVSVHMSLTTLMHHTATTSKFQNCYHNAVCPDAEANFDTTGSLVLWVAIVFRYLLSASRPINYSEAPSLQEPCGNSKVLREWEDTVRHMYLTRS